MTDGGPSVTIGGRRVRMTPWRVIALTGLVIVAVTTTSVILESRREGDGLNPIEPFIWEFTSYLMILALAPLIGKAIASVPPRRDGLAPFVLIHAALTIPFSLVHVAGMASMREALYWAAGERYGFLDDGALLVLIYEWRKDAVSYATLATVCWLFQRHAERQRAAASSPNARIEIRDGGAAVFLAPGEVLFVEAAGNYVEFHAASRTHLVRGTLASWETRLTERGFVRVHRSRLINRARIRALKPTPSGDVEITLDDGRTLSGSRRYRAALERAPAAPGA